MKTLALAIGLALIVSLPVSASTIRLYEPSVGLTPDISTADNGAYLLFGQTGGGTQTSLNQNGTNLNTTANNGISAGYSNRVVNAVGNPFINPFTPGAFVNSAFPNLDSSSGYSLKFNAAILSESNTSSDRAGFSVLVLGSDAQGIEIGFQDILGGGKVFAQNFNFTQGESSNPISLDIFRGATDYELVISGNTYSLRASNLNTPILAGALRSYNDTALLNPYRTPNFVFLGDNTSRAQASVNLGAVSITTTEVPFEFSPALGLLGVGAWAIAKKIKK
jgi:hypothetical protein